LTRTSQSHAGLSVEKPADESAADLVVSEEDLVSYGQSLAVKLYRSLPLDEAIVTPVVTRKGLMRRRSTSRQTVKGWWLQAERAHFFGTDGNIYLIASPGYGVKVKRNWLEVAEYAQALMDALKELAETAGVND
jgi:hypothetical protein